MKRLEGVARRYGRACFAVAAETAGAAQPDLLVAELQRFAKAYAGSALLRESLRSPALRAPRQALMAAMCRHLEVGPLGVRVLQLLARNNRIALVGAVAAAVAAQADAAAGRLRALVRTAVPLSDAQSGRIAAALGRRLGRPVVLDVRVEPGLQAGLVCQVGDFTLDSSLRRQLEIVTEHLGAHAL